MEDIIERLTSGKDLSLNRNVNHNEYPAADDDDVFSTLPLTSECESFDELSRFLSALSANTSVRRVVFRESFSHYDGYGNIYRNLNFFLSFKV